MADSVLERVMSCPNLPSLPAVAVEVLELTRDPNVPMRKIASAVELDQALSSKILRTVNSSFYGLTHPCPTISRALAYLGLSTVKTLVLSFSLVDMTKSTAAGDFDFNRYWRCVIYSAVAAREIAIKVGTVDPEEAFIGALLQDIGMLAMHTALGVDYAAIVSCADFKPEQLLKDERRTLGLTHPEAGEALAEKWRLPPDLVACIRDHHSPEQVTDDHMTIVRIVALAGDFAEAMSVMPMQNLNNICLLAKKWFDVDAAQVDEILEGTTAGAKELSRSFDVDTGAPPELDSIRASAHDRLVEHQMEMVQETTELSRQVLTDGLTGAANRKHFDETVPAEFETAKSTSTPMGVLFCDADKFKLVNDNHGHQAGDAVLVELSRRLLEIVGDLGTVYRYGGEEFTVTVPKADGKRAAQLAEIIRRRIMAVPIDVTGTGAQVDSLDITLSIGVAAFEPGKIDYETHTDLVRAADENVYVAKECGRNRVALAGVGVVRLQKDGSLRVEGADAPVAEPSAATPTAPEPVAEQPAAPVADAAPIPLPEPAPTPAAATKSSNPIRVLIFSPDPSSDRVQEALTVAGADLTIVTDEPDTMNSLREAAPNLLLVGIGGGNDHGVSVIEQTRADDGLCATPVIALIGTNDNDARRQAMRLGANAIIDLERFNADPDLWTDRILKLWWPDACPLAA